MDLIYMNPNKEDIGVLKDYILDMAYGVDENNFECTVSSSNNVCEAGFYLYAEGTEYGGIIDSINVDTESETVVYKGRTWHGILDSKIFEPDAGNDYLVVSGESNTVLSTLISRIALDDLFKVQGESGVNISSYKMNRYISGYAGILKMLKSNGAKLNVIFKNGFVELSAEPLVDYSQDEQFDTDQISFTIEKNYKPINHVICLGQGDLKDRRVIHLYADGVGNISGTQTFTGIDEVCVTYDNSNAESDEELIEGGVEIIKASWASDTIEFDFESDDESFDINDIVGAKEFTTGAEVKASITKKIIKIQDYTTSISYSCESGVGTVASSGYPSSGSGGSGGTTTTVTANVGKTTTGEPGTNASVTNSGTNTNVVFDFVIPRGEKGEKGDKGDKGDKGEKGEDGGVTIEQMNAALAGKSNTDHTHDDRYYTESEMDTKLASKSNNDHNHNGVYAPMFPNAMADGGILGVDGNLFMDCHGYNGWLTDILNAIKGAYVPLAGGTMTGTLVIQSGNLNGNYNGLLVGDDCYIGDCNVGNCIGLKGVSANNTAFIRFGVNGGMFGFNGNEFTMDKNLFLNGFLRVNASGWATTSIKLLTAGSTVLMGNGGTSVGLISDDTLRTWIDNYHHDYCAVLVSNGDGIACGAHMDCATYQNGMWYVVFDRAVATSTAMRINWVVIHW